MGFSLKKLNPARWAKKIYNSVVKPITGPVFKEVGKGWQAIGHVAQSTVTATLGKGAGNLIGQAWTIADPRKFSDYVDLQVERVTNVQYLLDGDIKGFAKAAVRSELNAVTMQMRHCAQISAWTGSANRIVTGVLPSQVQDIHSKIQEKILGAVDTAFASDLPDISRCAVNNGAKDKLKSILDRLSGGAAGGAFESIEEQARSERVTYAFQASAGAGGAVASTGVSGGIFCDCQGDWGFFGEFERKFTLDKVGQPSQGSAGVGIEVFEVDGDREQFSNCHTITVEVLPSIETGPIYDKTSHEFKGIKFMWGKGPAVLNKVQEGGLKLVQQKGENPTLKIGGDNGNYAVGVLSNPADAFNMHVMRNFTTSQAAVFSVGPKVVASKTLTEEEREMAAAVALGGERACFIMKGESYLKYDQSIRGNLSCVSDPEPECVFRVVSVPGSKHATDGRSAMYVQTHTGSFLYFHLVTQDFLMAQNYVGPCRNQGTPSEGGLEYSFRQEDSSGRCNDSPLTLRFISVERKLVGFRIASGPNNNSRGHFMLGTNREVNSRLNLKNAFVMIKMANGKVLLQLNSPDPNWAGKYLGCTGQDLPDLTVAAQPHAGSLWELEDQMDGTVALKARLRGNDAYITPGDDGKVGLTTTRRDRGTFYVIDLKGTPVALRSWDGAGSEWPDGSKIISGAYCFRLDWEGLKRNNFKPPFCAEHYPEKLARAMKCSVRGAVLDGVWPDGETVGLAYAAQSGGLTMLDLAVASDGKTHECAFLDSEGYPLHTPKDMIQHDRDHDELFIWAYYTAEPVEGRPNRCYLRRSDEEEGSNRYLNLGDRTFKAYTGVQFGEVTPESNLPALYCSGDKRQWEILNMTGDLVGIKTERGDILGMVGQTEDFWDGNWGFLGKKHYDTPASACTFKMIRLGKIDDQSQYVCFRERKGRFVTACSNGLGASDELTTGGIFCLTRAENDKFSLKCDDGLYVCPPAPGCRLEVPEKLVFYSPVNDRSV